MFDSEFAAADDAQLVAAIEDGVRAEAAVAARRLAAIAELVRRRVDEDDERAVWAFDPWDSVPPRWPARSTSATAGHRARCASRSRCATASRGWQHCTDTAS
jgi:hypothetical protein